ncbi:AraC family transcriptional regulator (plasmid) [Streptomyces clavuligerus]|nr:helix-turn-helix domain-containing protein [Streptomyces clavuligerus]EDY47215.1 araC family regulatory protein [Streptomyces clavuligerus]QCS10714.1 AraC family transcriptional regulator [Streptomyces clavuligerus]QPJ97250.1 helix-turn-helix domain-containing protein [Streptomyces clavuligerus]WDN57427.1 helix-turn-helix domain-containing protein [Streptomyces clavuligerus]
MSTENVAAADRADWYHDVISRTVAPHELTVTDPSAFRARSGGMSLGRIGVSRHFHTEHSSRRTPRLIRQGDPEHFVLGVITHGAKKISQHRTDTVLGTGDGVLFDTSHPYAVGTPGTGSSGMTFLHIPRTLLSFHAPRLDTVLPQRFPTGHGLAAILRHFIDSLHTHTAECTPQERRILDRTALDLVTGFVAEQTDTWAGAPADTPQRVLLHRVDAFIDDHLGDPRLDPRAVADHHHISLRTLQALFRTREEGIAASIKRRRLDRCRADLSAPGQAGVPIGVIAARWGFGRPAGFSRAFRDTYGISPQEYRNQQAAEGARRANQVCAPGQPGGSRGA